MKNILLSICIPTYNRVDTLRICLQRIFEARNNHIDEVEIIVSDNCSSDSTFDFLRTIQEKNFRFYRNNENVGFNKNVILLVEKYAKGKYAWTIGDDDYVSMQSIDMFFENYHNADLILMKHKVTDVGDLNTECLQIRDLKTISGSYYQAIDAIAQPSNLLATFMSCAIFDREKFNSVNKINILENDWIHFENVFFNGYVLFSAFRDSEKILWTQDHYVFVIPIVKSWDDKMKCIYQDIIPRFYRGLSHISKKQLKQTKYILFKQELFLLLNNKSLKDVNKDIRNIITFFSSSNVMTLINEKIKKTTKIGE